MKANTVGPQVLTIAGKRVVVLEEPDYRRLAVLAGHWEPPMPAPDVDGNYPADETLAVLLARKLIRRRLDHGLDRDEHPAGWHRHFVIQFQRAVRLERALNRDLNSH